MVELLSEPLLSVQPLSTKSIKVLSLNLFLRPPLIKNNFSDYKEARLAYFCNKILENYDIVCLQEMFAAFNTRRSRLIQLAISKGLLYSAYCPSPSFWKPQAIDGGLVILSRYPILESDFFGFGNGVFPDFFSLKGILYVKISISNKIIHVFTIHTQATYPSEDLEILEVYKQVRKEQLKSSVKFINSKVQFTNEPFLLVGDFNTDGKSNEYDSLIQNLEELDMQDVLRMKYGYSPSSYGIQLPNGEPEETILSHKRENKRDVAIDYIFLSKQGNVSVNYEDTGVEPFYINDEVFTRISDHYGVQTTILL